MNFKDALIFGVSVGMVVSGIILNRSMKVGFDNDVKNSLDTAVNNKFGSELNDARNDLILAKAEAKKVYSAETQTVKDRLLSNDEYQQAKITYEANKSQIDILKKTLKTAQEGNSTQVAVGSGDSAVAVSIKDTSKISQIQSDISKLEVEMKTAEANKNRIWNLEHSNVVKERTPDQIKTIEAVKEADKALTKVDFEKNFYKNQLMEDEHFMAKAEAEAYVKYYTPARQIASSVLVTVPMLCLLTELWVSTGKCLKLYFDLKKGVA